MAFTMDESSRDYPAARRMLRNNLTVHSSSPQSSRFAATTPVAKGASVTTRAEKSASATARTAKGASSTILAGPTRARRKEAMPARYRLGLAGSAVRCPISPQREVALHRSAIRPNHRGDCDCRSEIQPRGGLPVVGGRSHTCRRARALPGGRNYHVRPTSWHRPPPFRLPQSASPWPW